jgi:hypothetical protein
MQTYRTIPDMAGTRQLEKMRSVFRYDLSQMILADANLPAPWGRLSWLVAEDTKVLMSPW